MSLEPCTFLPDTAAACSQTSFLDTDQLSLLSGTHTPVKSSENEQPMNGFPACTCMKEMSACLMHPSTPTAWIAFMQDSLVKTLALLESRQAYLREPDQVFTEKSCASLAWYDQNSCSWKTYQQSLVTDWEPYSATWPRWGMTAAGSAYAHPMSERRITEIDGFYWPTSQARDYRSGDVPGSKRAMRKAAQGWSMNLNDAVMYPTPVSIDAGTGRFNTSIGGKPRPTLAMMAKRNISPTATATAYKGWSPGHNRAATDDRLDYSVEREAFTTGQQTPPMRLNPYWVEWLMGFPIGFTVSKGWVTRSVRSKQPQPTACSEAAE